MYKYFLYFLTRYVISMSIFFLLILFTVSVYDYVGPHQKQTLLAN